MEVVRKYFYNTLKKKNVPPSVEQLEKYAKLKKLGLSRKQIQKFRTQQPIIARFGKAALPKHYRCIGNPSLGQIFIGTYNIYLISFQYFAIECVHAFSFSDVDIIFYLFFFQITENLTKI